MTRFFNKKATSLLVSILLAICWFAMPVSAETVNEDMDYFAEGASITRICDIDEVHNRSITSCLLRNLTVAAYGGIGSDGNPIAYSINGEYGYAEGASTILNCTLPSTFYQGMIDLGYNEFIGILVFSVEGTNLQRVVLEVDDDTKVNASLNSSGWYTITWTSSRKLSTAYELIVYSNNVSSAQWGHITVA